MGTRTASDDDRAFASCEEFEKYLFEHLLPDTDVLTERIGDGCLVVVSSLSHTGTGVDDPATILATYDGRNHFELNIFSPTTNNSILSLAEELSNPDDLPGFLRRQIDLHPRGYGR